MNTLELKSALHKLIDEADSDRMLLYYFQILTGHSELEINQIDPWNSLSAIQKAELLEAISESENPENLIPHEDILKKHDQWFRK